eukprot:GILJ01013398.1.p1 GENE.GILJ01013398.1~~GILJ01013398.1.p1  ORF type:complete len:345 (+),score=38.21 GILJ01013398.1:52-1086(+)
MSRLAARIQEGRRRQREDEEAIENTAVKKRKVEEFLNQWVPMPVSSNTASPDFAMLLDLFRERWVNHEEKWKASRNEILMTSRLQDGVQKVNTMMDILLSQFPDIDRCVVAHCDRPYLPNISSLSHMEPMLQMRCGHALCVPCKYKLLHAELDRVSLNPTSLADVVLKCPACQQVDGPFLTYTRPPVPDPPVVEDLVEQVVEGAEEEQEDVVSEPGQVEQVEDRDLNPDDSNIAGPNNPNNPNNLLTHQEASDAESIEPLLLEASGGFMIQGIMIQHDSTVASVDPQDIQTARFTILQNGRFVLSYYDRHGRPLGRSPNLTSGEFHEQRQTIASQHIPLNYFST